MVQGPGLLLPVQSLQWPSLCSRTLCLGLLMVETAVEGGKPGTVASKWHPAESPLGSGCQVASQINTFLLAGYETTASALAFTAYHVALNPHKEATLLAEIDGFGRGRIPTLEELDEVGDCTAWL